MKWATVKFSELFRVKHGYAFKSNFFDTSGGFVLLTPGSFHEEGGYREQGDKTKFYTGDIPDGFLLNEGDLLVAMTEQAPGLLGSSAWVPQSNRFLHNQRLGRIVDLAEHRLDPRFLYYLFNTRGVRAQIAGSASGTKVRHTAPERIGRVEVELPPVKVQRTIAAMLTAYDGLMETNRRRIEVLEESARLLYQEWFVRLRFPGHEHAPIAKGIPQGWDKKPLEAVCTEGDGIQTGPFGSQLHQSDYTDEGVPVVMPKDIIQYRISVEGIARIPEELADKLGRHRMIPGDTVYGRRGDIGRRAFISRRQSGWFCGTGSLRIRPNPKEINPRYLFDTLGSPDTAGTIANRAKGATMLNLNGTVLKSVPLLIAPRALQDIYADEVGPMADMVEILAVQNEKLAAARDLLLPRLMNGEISV